MRLFVKSDVSETPNSRTSPRMSPSPMYYSRQYDTETNRLNNSMRYDMRFSFLDYYSIFISIDAEPTVLHDMLKYIFRTQLRYFVEHVRMRLNFLIFFRLSGRFNRLANSDNVQPAMVNGSPSSGKRNSYGSQPSSRSRTPTHGANYTSYYEDTPLVNGDVRNSRKFFSIYVLCEVGGGGVAVRR